MTSPLDRTPRPGGGKSPSSGTPGGSRIKGDRFADEVFRRARLVVDVDPVREAVPIEDSIVGLPGVAPLWSVDEIVRRLRISGFRRATPAAVRRTLRERYPALAALRGDVFGGDFDAGASSE